MAAFNNIEAALGGIGNSLGIQGSGPGGLNALQRASLSPEQSSAYTQQTALAKLAQDPNFMGLPPDQQQATILKVTGDPVVAQKVSALSQLAKMNTADPRGFIQQGVQSGNIAPTDALNALANPMLQTGQQPPVSNPPAPNSAPNATPAGSVSPQPSFPGGLGPDGPDDNRNYKFLQTVPPVYRGLVKGISEGDEHAGMIARANPQSAYIMNSAYSFDPTLSQPGAGPDSRVKTNVEFGAGGKQGITRAAINTTIQHASQLAAATYDLHNRQSPQWNSVANSFEQGVAGNDAGSNFDAIADRLAPELAKVSSGTGAATEGETAVQRAGFQKNGSPQQQYGALSNIMELVSNKSKELGNTYKSSMGRSIQMISPENQQHLADIQALTKLAKNGKQNSPEAQAIVARLRNVETPTAPAAAPPSKYIEGQTYRSRSTGKMFVIKNGVPVPSGGGQ